MVYLDDTSCCTCRFRNLIRRKGDTILTKKDYHRAFIKNPSFFLKKGKVIGHFRAYLKSPSDIYLSKKVKSFLFLALLDHSVIWIFIFEQYTRL